ncbi:MAG: hypothetical protein ABEN55_01395, partial [Bradymonadaceae bacterium]
RQRYGRLGRPICQICVGGEDGVLAGTITGEIHMMTGGSEEGAETFATSYDGEPTGLDLDMRRRWAAVIEREGRLQVLNASQSFNVEPVPSGFRSVSFGANGQILGLTLDDSVLQLWVFHHEPVARQSFQ